MEFISLRPSHIIMQVSFFVKNSRENRINFANHFGFAKLLKFLKFYHIMKHFTSLFLQIYFFLNLVRFEELNFSHKTYYKLLISIENQLILCYTNSAILDTPTYISDILNQVG